MTGKTVAVKYIGSKGGDRLTIQEEDYARMLKSALSNKGLEATGSIDRAEFIVLVQMYISDPKEVSSQIPVYNTTGGTSYQSGSFSANTYGQGASSNTYGQYSGTSYAPTQIQYAGSYTQTDVMYHRTLFAEGLIGDEYRATLANDPGSKGAQQVWECTVKSTGSSGSLAEIAPYLIAALEDCFGKAAVNQTKQYQKTSKFAENRYPASQKTVRH